MIDLQAAEIAAGIRVGLELPEGGTCVALIERVSGDTIHLELLDDPPEGALKASTLIDVFLPRDAGLYRWATRVAQEPDGNTTSLVILGPASLLQRRRTPRVEVDLAAVVSRVRGGRRGKPEEAHIVDLSRGGMKLLGGASLVTADTVEVAVDLGLGRLALTGRVVMSHPGPGGDRVSHIAFSEELSPALAVIDDYVGRRLNND